mgnify:FL=1
MKKVNAIVIVAIVNKFAIIKVVIKSANIKHVILEFIYVVPKNIFANKNASIKEFKKL